MLGRKIVCLARLSRRLLLMRSRNAHEDTLLFSMTLEYLETYMPKQLGLSPQTIKAHRDALTVFRRFLLEEKKVSIQRFAFAECTPALMQDFIVHMKSIGNSTSTCNRRLSSIRSYLWFASNRNIALQSVALRMAKIPSCCISSSTFP